MTTTNWIDLADQVLKGTPLTTDQAESILQSSDLEVLEIMSAAYRVRHHYFGNDVQLYFLMNAKSGLCAEDCHYCSQSKISSADIPKYSFLNRKSLMDGAKKAAENNSKTYCIVISGRSPTERELAAVESIVPEIKENYPLKICACLGLLNDEQAGRLKQCGVDRVNHNLNTSEGYYDDICTTHSFADRLETLHSVRRAGLEICSGGIIGMGEKNRDIVDMAMALRDLEAESIPLNFLNAIDGTPLEGSSALTPQYCLKALAMFRLTNPSQELRIAGGREIHLRSLQPLGLYAANSIFVGDYLTTSGQAPDEDFKMIEDLGFNVTVNEEPTVSV